MPAGARELDRASPLPLWAQWLEDLRRRLGTGEFDERFPSELQLVAQYAVSRHTVREVLRRLRAEGTVLGALLEADLSSGSLYEHLAEPAGVQVTVQKRSWARPWRRGAKPANCPLALTNRCSASSA